VLAGEHAIHGFRNRDLQARLYSGPAQSPRESMSRCARVSRSIGNLRGHGLMAKVPGSRLYRVTDRPSQILQRKLITGPAISRLEIPRSTRPEGWRTR